MAKKGCGPYNLGAPKSVAKQTKYEVKVNDDTGNQVGMRATDSRGDVKNYDRPTTQEIRHSKKRMSEGLSATSDFSKKHTYKDNLIFVDGKPRTNFAGNTGYAMDSQNIQNAIRSTGQDPKNVHMGNLKIKNPKVHQMVVGAFNSDTKNQAKKLQSQNSLVEARSQFRELPKSPGSKLKSAFKMKGYGSKY